MKKYFILGFIVFLIASCGGDDNNGNNNEGNSTPSGYKLYQGATTFAYPGSWGFLPRNAQSMPQLKQIVANSNN